MSLYDLMISWLPSAVNLVRFLVSFLYSGPINFETIIGTQLIEFSNEALIL